MDLVIAGATVVLEDRAARLHVGVSDGRIAALVDGAAAVPSATRVIDAEGLMLLPGAIDAHTHFTAGHDDILPEIEAGTAGAAKAGVTTVIEMPHMNPPATTLERFLAKRETMAAHACVDFALWGGLTGANLDQIAPMHEAGAVAMKAFSCSGRADRAAGDARGLPGLDDDALSEALREIAAVGSLLGLHAENHDIIQGSMARLRAAGADGGRAHGAAQPEIAETEAVARAIHLAGHHGARLHIVHLSTGNGARIIDAARSAGRIVTVETCPQYLVLDEDDLERIGGIARCGPPIRPRATVEDLWAEVATGTIDALTSDHCPYPIALKETASIWEAAMGLTGIETTTPIFIGAALDRGLDPALIGRMIATGPARIFGLYGRKGAIAPGFDADLILLDPKGETVIDAAAFEGQAKWSPFDGTRCTGRIRATFLRGTEVFSHAGLAAWPGAGQFLPRA
ncbi:allantoinase AllB [Amaricoccus solimangrovi]|uniref:Allantoinase AllB n=1 Tax=Amaricoccus solimangrovi TaxID=2589815 RepID=A0A501WIT4_9RHOB|nr:allantoinase AllB [Amaricoccus solimangrovi]TPE48034.1 allantoinase AllB [Amaricoccus solimangrovi]